MAEWSERTSRGVCDAGSEESADPISFSSMKFQKLVKNLNYFTVKLEDSKEIATEMEKIRKFL